MRLFFRILLLPFSLLITVFVNVSMFLIERCAVLLNIISGIMVVAAIAGYSQYLFGWPLGIAGEATTLQLAVIGTALAFILCPYGLPALALWMLGKLDNLNSAIKSL
jgi:hypothetical protein